MAIDIDKMRQKQLAVAPGQAAPPVPAAPAPVPAPVANSMTKKKQKQPPAEKAIIGYEAVAHACGHVLPFKLYDGADTYRKERRKKHTDQKCSDCRIREHNAQQEAQAAQSAKSPSIAKGRLPDGSSFTPAPVWNADAKEWSGGLRIGKEGEGGPTFLTTASGVMGLFRALDAQYRAFLRRSAEPATEGDHAREIGG